MYKNELSGITCVKMNGSEKSGKQKSLYFQEKEINYDIF